MNNKDTILLNSLVEGLQTGERRWSCIFFAYFKCPNFEVLGSDLEKKQACRMKLQSFDSPKQQYCLILALIIKM